MKKEMTVFGKVFCLVVVVISGLAGALIYSKIDRDRANELRQKSFVQKKIDGSKVRTIRDVSLILDAMNLTYGYDSSDQQQVQKAESIKHLFK